MSPAMYLVLALVLLLAALFALARAFELVPAGRIDASRRIAGSQRPGAGSDGAGGLSGEQASLGLWRGVASAKSLTTMERNLAVAGKSVGAVRTQLKIKVFAPLLVALLGLSVASGSSSPMIWIALLIGIVVAYRYPDIYCSSRATEQKAAMVASLPDVLDQLTIAIDAGMSFEAAFARVGATHRGPLGPQIMRTVQDMAVGMPRREAYLALAERNDIDDLSQLMRSLVQAEEFGVPISQVVRLLGDEMRDKRRQRAAAKAQTVPLKLMFPMMTCLLPVLFIILLTPAVLGLSKSL